MHLLGSGVHKGGVPAAVATRSSTPALHAAHLLIASALLRRERRVARHAPARAEYLPGQTLVLLIDGGGVTVIIAQVLHAAMDHDLGGLKNLMLLGTRVSVLFYKCLKKNSPW